MRTRSAAFHLRTASRNICGILTTMTKRPEGLCRLCGEHKPLSFEHIPPKSAFNDSQRLFQTMQDLLAGRSRSKFRGGIGKNTLCERCNNLTGRWYGGAFADWSKQGLELFDKFGRQPPLALPFYIRPLNVIKQITVMALAMAAEQTQNYHYELRRFVLNKEQRYLPPKYNVHAYFNMNGQP